MFAFVLAILWGRTPVVFFAALGAALALTAYGAHLLTKERLLGLSRTELGVGTWPSTEAQSTSAHL